MSDHCFGVGVLVVGVGEDRATIQQIPKSPRAQVIDIARQSVRPKPIHRQLQHEPGCSVLTVCERRRQRRSRQRDHENSDKPER